MLRLRLFSVPDGGLLVGVLLGLRDESGVGHVLSARKDAETEGRSSERINWFSTSVNEKELTGELCMG
jgi:hypothetical protein